MKNITIGGNIGRDAELKDTKAGPVCKFSVAVKARKKDDPAVWFNVSIFGKRGETLCQYLRKGSSVVVTGDLDARTYEAKDGSGTRLDLGVNASEITLMGGNREDRENSTQPVQHSPRQTRHTESNGDWPEGEIPFRQYRGGEQ